MKRVQNWTFTQQQALNYVGKRVKTIRRAGAPKLSQMQEGIEAIATTIIAHLTVSDLQFRGKSVIYCGNGKKCLMTMHNPKMVDDRDYVGNKRLELAGVS